MCILCVIQKWSRRIATMLPWFVIPLIGLWFLSQFLPPAFRFEITSPRLACVLVLLITLFWYEILMPQLSAWRVRRNARLRERKRSEAIEMQKLRKTATRRCRNCLTPYRDQNPGGGKFMCAYCGHVSKRPVLDLPIPPGLGLSNSGIMKDLAGKGGTMFNGKVWSDNGWICGQDWLENSGNWAGGCYSFSIGGDAHCFAEKSYSRLVVFLCKILASGFLGIRWLWRKIFRVRSSDEDALADADITGLSKKGENGVNCNESRIEKARRKAEEKRQAKLEKEQLEQEERKQREEVARLVEEQRKLRDVKTKSEKDHEKTSPHDKNKKETERKRQEKKKEKDRASSKSNSDIDELEKRAVIETEISKNHKVESEKVNFNYNARYLDRMRGSLLSSSRAFTGGGFFGNRTIANTNSMREHKSITTLDHAQNAANTRDFGKLNASADDKNINRPVQVEPHPVAPKKSWQQLFTRTPTVASSPSTNVISRPKANSQKEAQNVTASSGYQATQGFDNPITFELSSTLPNRAYTGLHLSSNSIFPEEPDVFEDPCYVPDPVSLIGPVSKSLDNFQLDLGFVPGLGFQKPHPIEPAEVNRPSPIESPLARLRILDEKHANMNGSLFGSNKLPTENEKGWQVWDSVGLVGDPSSWLLRPEVNTLTKEGVMQPQSQKTMASLFKKDEIKTTFNRGVHATDDYSWMQRTSYGPMSVTESHVSQNHIIQNDLGFGIPNGSASSHPFQAPQADFWPIKESAAEGKGSASSSSSSSATTRPVGGLYSTSDVQSLWSYE